MSADPVWCLLRIQPFDVLKVKKVFDEAVENSQILNKLQNYLQNRTENKSQFHPQEQETFNSYFPNAFVNKAENEDIFDWEDLHNVYHLFFPRSFTEIFDYLFIGDAPIISMPMSQALLELIITNRVGATEILWGGLGWKRASRLPGYLGNMFVLPEDIANVLTIIEEIFAEVSIDEFVQGARTIGARGNCNESYAERLQSLILSCFSTVLHEGNGLLALSYPHMGSMPFPENY
ncbi:hypothetical protein BV372_13675 [Nostoc sp. T09]|uniref:hypothetical protein n=1 Tax=Nostoc sp. T09 TaxID=1932621 RepID=UPI000A3BC71B|nr:hypothetical protein [Nostoc sp. T09]OUL34450.1 hypothetical protein BV372_13675 [Nostoc sp. T09]